MRHQRIAHAYSWFQWFLVCLLLLLTACSTSATANGQPASFPTDTPIPAVAPTATSIPTVAPTATPKPTSAPQPPPQATAYVASGGSWNFNDNTNFDNNQTCLNNDSNCIGDINMTTTTYSGAPAISFNGQQYVFILDADFTILDVNGSNYSITQHLSHWRWQLQRSFGDNNFQHYDNWDQSGSYLTNGQPSDNSGDIWVHAIFHANPSDCQGDGSLRRLRFAGIDVFANPNLVTNAPYADIYLVCH